MKRMLALFALAALLAFAQNSVRSQELLSNGNLNATHQVGDPALYWPEFVGWEMITDPCSYSPCPISPYVPVRFTLSTPDIPRVSRIASEAAWGW